jgi:hypothetical protein
MPWARPSQISGTETARTSVPLRWEWTEANTRQFVTQTGVAHAHNLPLDVNVTLLESRPGGRRVWPAEGKRDQRAAVDLPYPDCAASPPPLSVAAFRTCQFARGVARGYTIPSYADTILTCRNRYRGVARFMTIASAK